MCEQKFKWLTPKVRKDIYNEYMQDNITQMELADKYGITQKTVSVIIKRGRLYLEIINGNCVDTDGTIAYFEGR